ncbi:hypothetical protein [Leuconostoc gasicomitatum]|uniref:hypothetical protein n=1 Tax=Leuconostoc gasicomitatum TaxID=115778 RepID=UPI0007E0519F|nr:hypothetical protein [Leuconostoc gasicomitatum]CUW11235.1 hypothetical protein PB1E_1795 [Leuconostoc gasicomitatum]
MFGFKKKQTLPNQYFARIEQGDLNFDAGNLQEIADSTGTLVEDWPNVSLQDLQTFLSRATNDVVRASGQDLTLQRIVYMTVNDKGQAEPTGLSWEHVTIDAGFENFVVSTTDHILNDSEVRQDEEMTYDIIFSALESLQEAALEYTDLTVDDMPNWPSSEVYRDAQETGEKITVQPLRFDQLVSLDNKLEQLPDSPELKQESIEPTVSTIPEPEKTPDLMAKASETSQPAITKPIVLPSNPAQQLIDKIDLPSPLFQVNRDNQAHQDQAESQAYVAARLNVEKQKANEFLVDTSNQLTRQVQSALAKVLKEKHTRFSDQLATIQNTDVQSAIAEQMTGERQSEFDARYLQRKTAREAGYHAEVATENDRHEQTLNSLKNGFVVDLENLKLTVNQELDDWFTQRSLVLSTDFTQQLQERSITAQKSYDEAIVIELTQLSANLINENDIVLQDMYAKLAKEIETKRQEFEIEHTNAIEQTMKLTSIQNEAKNLGALEAQIQALKVANIDLEKRLKDKANKQVDNDTLSQLKTQLSLMQGQPKIDKSDQINDQLMTLLTQQLKPKTIAKKSGVTGWQAIAIGMMVAFVLGAVGVSSYSLAQHQQATTAKKQISSSTEMAKTITMAPPTATSQANAVSSSQSKNAPEAATSSSSTNDTNALSSRFHKGDQVNVTINGQNVSAPVTEISDKTITVHYDGFDYVVPMS